MTRLFNLFLRLSQSTTGFALLFLRSFTNSFIFCYCRPITRLRLAPCSPPRIYPACSGACSFCTFVFQSSPATYLNTETFTQRALSFNFFGRLRTGFNNCTVRPVATNEPHVSGILPISLGVRPCALHDPLGVTTRPLSLPQH